MIFEILDVEMASSQIFNALGKIGVGLAIAGGVVNSALYNGKSSNCSLRDLLYGGDAPPIT